MEYSSKLEDEWQTLATSAAIAGARKIALGSGPLMNTPVGRLTDDQWGWVVTAVIFEWITVRVEQAVEEGLSDEATVRSIAAIPSACDVAVVRSVLPTLADTAAIDWTQPLRDWSKDTMTSFLLAAWELIRKAEIARDHGPGGILRKPKPAGVVMDDENAVVCIPQEQRAAAWNNTRGKATHTDLVDDVPFDL
jgi:hypothetical protein